MPAQAMKQAQKWIRAGLGVLVVLTLLTCSDSSTERQAKPTFDWGYPEYSQYTASGEHVGTTIYQRDPECRHRLTFYACDFVDAETPDTPTTNPTGASTQMTGGLDSCTSAIAEARPSYCIPADVCNPTRQKPAWAPGQASSDNLAWQLFIAVNWPADPEQPGYPDVDSQPGARDPDGAQHAGTVWLDYPTADELFGIPSPCEGPTLQMQSKLSDAFLSKSPPPGAFGDVVEPGGGVLVDQNGGVVHFDIRVNRTMWEFIVNQTDYWKTGTSLAGLKQNVRRDYELPPGETPGAFPAARGGEQDGRVGDIGSMEIKTAWKILTPAEIAGGTYYTRNFALDDPDGPVENRCRRTTMGLVGMHIVYQPAFFGNPEWVWATFEHRANVPTAGINDGATEFSFYDPSCTPVKTPAECATYQAGVSSPAEFRCCPNLALYPDASNLPASPVPNQITRATNPSVSTILPTDCTDHYTAAIARHFGADNVWTNYFLVSTQWPLRGASTNFPFYEPEFEATFPCTLGNTTLETFLVAHDAPRMNGCNLSAQKPFCRACNGDCVATEAEAQASCPGGEETSEASTTADCMGCHGTYAPQNSSFIFSHRPCCVRRDGFVPNVCGALTERTECETSQTCTWVASDPACGS